MKRIEYEIKFLIGCGVIPWCFIGFFGSWFNLGNDHIIQKWAIVGFLTGVASGGGYLLFNTVKSWVKFTRSS